jgi:NAD+ diphosphatase
MKPEKKLHYSGVDFDRAAARRKNPDWIDQQFTSPDSLFIPVWQSKNLVSVHDNNPSPQAVYFSKEKYSSIKEVVSEIVFLGLDSGKAHFTCDLSGINEPDLKAIFPEGTFTDLRQIGQSMYAKEAARLAYARGILHWHKNHLFCGKCGSKSTSKSGGHMRLCSNAECNNETFPRTDPAVIMLVEHVSQSGKRRCLLGRHSKSSSGAFSTLAGFVDPGESLEEAVAREVFEEAGIQVAEVAYQG